MGLIGYRSLLRSGGQPCVCGRDAFKVSHRDVRAREVSSTASFLSDPLEDLLSASPLPARCRLDEPPRPERPG